MNNNKILYSLILITTVLVITALILKNKGIIGGEKAIEVTTSQSKITNITEIVTATGRINPVTEVKITSEVSGEVIQLFVEEGQAVEKGKLLARVRPDSYIALVEQTEANRDNAFANLENAKARKRQVESQLHNAQIIYERNKGLYDKKILSKLELETSETNYKSLLAEMESADQAILAAQHLAKGAKATIIEARDNLSKTNIFSPIAGVISILNIKEGEKVVGTLQMAGTEIMRVVDFDAMEVRVDVNENDVIRVKKGDTATIEIDAYLNRKFKGVVTHIAHSSNTSSSSTMQSTNFRVQILILKDSYEDLIKDNGTPFRPGMSATVDIATLRKNNILTIPLQAVTIRRIEDKDQEVVFVVDGNKAKMKVIKTGIQDNTNIEVLEGLNEKEEIIIGPYSAISNDLEDGKSIKIKE